MKANRLKKKPRPKAPARKKKAFRAKAPAFSWEDAVHILILLAFCGVFFFSALGARSLYETDEARYAEIPREMIASGDYITPRLNYVKYFEKPPLAYWLTALSFKLFGVSAFSARLVPAVCGTLTVLLTFLLGRGLWGPREGFLSALVLASSALFFGLGRVLMVDMVLTLGVTLALYGAWRERRELPGGIYCFWLGCAIGFLSKGLLGPGLPMMAVTFFVLLTREWSLARRLLRWPGLALFTVLCAPWVIWVSIVNPDFFNFFFIEEHLSRLLTNRRQRHQPFYFYIMLLPAVFFPWFALLPWSLASRWPGKAWREQDRRAWLFAFVWFASFFLFLTASNSKMVHYILPLMPALALLTGRPLALLAASGWKGLSPGGVRFSLAALALLTMAAGAVIPILAALNPDISYGQAGITLLAGPALAAAVGLAIFSLRERTWAALAAPLAVFVALALCAAVIAPRLDDYRSVKGLVAPLKERLGPGDVLVSYGDYYQGAPFYSGRRVVVVRNWGELDFGRRRDPNSARWFLPDDDAFLKLLLNPKKRVLAIAETDHYLRFRKWVGKTPGILLFEWMRLGDKSLFSNRPLE